MNSDILYFNIRSKECQQNTNNADLIVSLPFSIDLADDEWLQIEVISAEIPLSFYNISSALQNNIFNYSKIPGGNVSLIIPSGNYTVDSLMSTINGLQNDFTMSYSDVFNKFLITLNAPITAVMFVYSASDYTQQLFGIIASQQITSSSYFYGVVNLASVHSILVRSSLNSGNSASTSQSNNDIIQKISLDVNYGGMIIFNQNSIIRKNIIKSGSIYQFYLKLTEQNQKILDLNSCNWEMSLLFTKIKHEINNVSPEQLERRTNNYIQPEPPQPTTPRSDSEPEQAKPQSPPITNNYQPVSSYSSVIEPVQEPSGQPIKTQINEPSSQTEIQQAIQPMTTQPQTQTEMPKITQIPPLGTVENKDNNGLDNENKQDIPHDNLYDLLYSLIDE
jgi:hypothetical protein